MSFSGILGSIQRSNPDGLIPGVVIYTAVVKGFCKAAKFDDAEGLSMMQFPWNLRMKIVLGAVKGCGRLQVSVFVNATIFSMQQFFNAVTMAAILHCCRFFVLKFHV